MRTYYATRLGVDDEVCLELLCSFEIEKVEDPPMLGFPVYHETGNIVIDVMSERLVVPQGRAFRLRVDTGSFVTSLVAWRCEHQPEQGLRLLARPLPEEQ